MLSLRIVKKHICRIDHLDMKDFYLSTPGTTVDQAIAILLFYNNSFTKECHGFAYEVCYVEI